MWIKKLAIKREPKMSTVLIIGIILFFFLFFGWNFGQKWWEVSKKMPASFSFIEEEKETKEAVPELEKEISKSLEEKEFKKEQFYREKAQKGEGLTHLARRALKNYLENNPQNFNLRPEHKVYIEDYLAKKMGSQWLKIGEEKEFSVDLIKKAIEKATQLTDKQLENLNQYSQLVPSLNY